MAADDLRTELLRRAVTLTAELDAAALDELFSADITVWSAGATASSHGEIAAELKARDEVFTDVKVDFGAVDVVGDRGYGEWVVTAVHSDALVLDGETVIEASGTPFTLHGLTVAEFDGDRISALRHYWNEVELLDGLGLLPAG